MYSEHAQPRTRRFSSRDYSPFDKSFERGASEEARAGVGAFMGTVYAWMTAGLTLSAGVAYWLSTQPEVPVSSARS